MIELRVTGENLADIIRQLSGGVPGVKAEEEKPTEIVADPNAAITTEAPSPVVITEEKPVEEKPVEEKPAPKKRTSKKKEEAPAPAPMEEKPVAEAPVAEEQPSPVEAPMPTDEALESVPAAEMKEEESATWKAPMPTYTEEEVRKALINLKDAKGKETLVAFLKDFGVGNFKQIPQEKYGEVMAKLKDFEVA